MEFIETPTKLGSHGTEYRLKSFQFQERKREGGKHGEVHFIATPTKQTQVAIKTQFIKSPSNCEDKAYRELRIFQALDSLKCPNFISLMDWFKIRNSPFTELATSKKNNQPQFLHLVMECAETTLFDLKLLNISELRSILFQVLFTLHIAQRSLEFNHNDLHLKNILLVPLGNNKIQTHQAFQILEPNENELSNYTHYVWETSKWLVKICDFGLSRVKLSSGELIWNVHNKFSQLYSETVDSRYLAEALSRIKVSFWDQQNEEKKLYKNLLTNMKKEIQGPSQLILHQFFAPLLKSQTTCNKASVPKSILPFTQIVETEPLKQKLFTPKKRIFNEMNKENMEENLVRRNIPLTKRRKKNTQKY